MKKKILYVAGVILAGLIVLIISCHKSGSSYMPSPNPGSGTLQTNASATIQNFAFSPAAIHLKTGGTVTWTNMDSAPHTVTDLGGAFDSGSITTNQSYSHTFATNGTYTYHCTIHSMMASATVVVGK